MSATNTSATNTSPTASQTRSRAVWNAIRGSRVTTIGCVLILLHVLIALAAPLLTPFNPVANDSPNALMGATWQHWAGTDQYGRDVLARTLYGGRYALIVSLFATAAAVGLGTILGCVAALRGGWFDAVLMRLLDGILAVPAILALLVVVTALGTGTAIIVLAITIIYAPQVTRVVRAAAQNIVPLDYVSAARARGESWWSILTGELLPNVIDVVAVEVALRASWVVLVISSLSFLGFGANPPTPDWGLMVAENRAAMTVVPLATLAPIIALATLVLGLNMAADGLSKSFGVDKGKAAA